MGPESLLELQLTLEELQHFLDARLKQMIQTLSAVGDTEASISQSAPVLWLSLQCYCLVYTLKSVYFTGHGSAGTFANESEQQQQQSDDFTGRFSSY